MVAFASVGGNASTTAATSLAVPFPASPVANNPLLLAMANGDTDAFTTPSGWTVLVANTIVANDLGCAIYWKKATGSESGSLTVSDGVSNAKAGVMAQYSGCDATSPVTTSVHTVSGASGVTTSPASGTLSPAPGVADMVVRFYCVAPGTAGTFTLTSPGGTWTQRSKQLASTTTFDAGVLCADKINGLDNQTLTSSKAGGWLVCDILLKNSGVAPVVKQLIVHNKYAQVNAGTI